MKNKAPLPLMEQLVMILVFALTAALFLQGFSLANHISHHQEARNQAVVLAQNAAELLKYTDGDYETISAKHKGTWDGRTLIICYDETWQSISNSDHASYTLQIFPLETDNLPMGKALIQVTEKENILFEITVAWQEVLTDDVQ